MGIVIRECRENITDTVAGGVWLPTPMSYFYIKTDTSEGKKMKVEDTFETFAIRKKFR